MLSGHRIPSPMCLAVGWEIQFHLRTRMLLSDDGEQFEATTHYVEQVTNLRQRGRLHTLRGTGYKPAPAGGEQVEATYIT